MSATCELFVPAHNLVDPVCQMAYVRTAAHRDPLHTDETVPRQADQAALDDPSFPPVPRSHFYAGTFRSRGWRHCGPAGDFTLIEDFRAPASVRPGRLCGVVDISNPERKVW
jgi:hypothetical protein